MKYKIIIPTHNTPKYLPACINTVINQDYNDYELIISDEERLI
jgi:glycosyltransferase involved in cell wall biosynthesis